MKLVSNYNVIRQNVTAKPIIAWVLDITHLDLLMGQKAHVFLRPRYSHKLYCCN